LTSPIVSIPRITEFQTARISRSNPVGEDARKNHDGHHHFLKIGVDVQ
jgi:hypothetical protein